MALQAIGRDSFDALLSTAREWAGGGRFEQRAAAAGLCEPALLTSPERVEATVGLLDRITESMTRQKDRRDAAYRALRQGMGYCWSVAIAAAPAIGKPPFERWTLSEDFDIRWMLRENLRKKRLALMDPDWVDLLQATIGRGGCTRGALCPNPRRD